MIFSARYGVLALLVLAIAANAIQRSQLRAAQAKQSALSAQLADAQRVLDQQADAMKETEQRAQTAAAIAQTYEEDLANAKRTADRTIADLRAGNLRLRNPASAVCPGQLPGAPAGAGVAPTTALVSESDQGRLVSIAATCDSVIKGLQAITQADRKRYAK